MGKALFLAFKDLKVLLSYKSNIFWELLYSEDRIGGY